MEDVNIAWAMAFGVQPLEYMGVPREGRLSAINARVQVHVLIVEEVKSVTAIIAVVRENGSSTLLKRGGVARERTSRKRKTTSL